MAKLLNLFFPSGWRKAGPFFKSYAIRWTCITIFFCMIGVLTDGRLFLEIILTLALIISATLSAVHWLFHKNYLNKNKIKLLPGVPCTETSERRFQMHGDIGADDGYEPDRKIERAVETYINMKLKSDLWEKAGSKFVGWLGQCSAVTQSNGQYEAYLQIWDIDFDDSDLIVNWFYEAGAVLVNKVSAVLYDGENGDRNGKTIDGAKQWVVEFQVKDGELKPAANTAEAPTDYDLEPAAFYRDYDNRYWSAKNMRDKIQTFKTQAKESETVQLLDSILDKMDELGI